MKYLSIDIETGGLDPKKHDLLELGIVAETGDPDMAVEDLPSLRMIFPRRDRTYRLSSWAVENHGSLLAEIGKADSGNGGPQTEGPAGVVIEGYPLEAKGLIRDWMEFHSIRGTQNLAGKNLASFDLPFLQVALGVPFSDILPHRRRILDPAILYSRPEDETLPNLAECRRRGQESGLLVPLTEEQKAAHTSLGDCREVIRLLRAKNI